MGLRADGNLAVLPPRRHSGGARCAARRGPSRVAAGAAYRRGSVVELKHNRSQFHPPAFFPIGRNEPRVLRRSEEHTSELQSRRDLVCRLLLEKKKKKY